MNTDNSMSKMSALTAFEKKLIRLIKERASIIWIKTFHKESIYDIISKLTQHNEPEPLGCVIPQEKILTWNIANGQSVFGKSPKSSEVNVKLTDVLQQFKKGGDGFDYDVLILDDISNLLNQTQEEVNTLIGILQEFVYSNTKWTKADRKRGIKPHQEKSIIIISPRLEIVENLNHMVEILEEPIPDETDIERELGFDELRTNPNLLNSLLKSRGMASTYSHGRYLFSRGFLKKFEQNSKKLIASLSGMYMYDIRRMLYSLQANSDSSVPMLQDFETITGKSLPEYIADEKKRIVQNSGLLQVIDIDYDSQKARVGNIGNLRTFLLLQKEIIDHIENYNPLMRKPKGILLVGAPGCGKSEAAKSVAAILGKPLLRLDIGALMGQYVGVSEHNLMEAIKIAEAAQPCVLWIDEIEKAFAGFGNSDSGNDITVMRMVGYFLTWMQERKSLVYMVATANNLDNLRPEFLRKGRWDKIFYLTYPDKDGVVDIFNCCLNKYGLKLDVDTVLTPNYDSDRSTRFDDLVKLMYEQEMSGADIDSVIVEAHNKAFSLDPCKTVTEISVQTCLEIVESSNVLKARAEADARAVDESMENYKIQSRRFEWDREYNDAKRAAIEEYRLSAGGMDYSRDENDLINEALDELRISSGRVRLDDEKQIKDMLRRQIRRGKEKDERAVKMIVERVDTIYSEKKAVTEHIRNQLSHKGREEQEKYYKAKGYESAS